MTRINTNVPSLIAQNRLQQSNNSLQESLTRLSTGLRINSGSDDPAGLIASEALRSEITGMNKAISNTKRASQIISTADSALGQVSSLLGDIRGLVVEAANSGALSDDEIAANQLQVDSSLEALNRIAQTTTFQGRKLLDGSLDFVSNVDSVSTVTDARIDQANLGATGSVTVDVKISAAAEQAAITSAATAFDVATPATAPAYSFTNQTGTPPAHTATIASTSFAFTNQSATVEGDIDITADSSIAAGTTITFLDDTFESDGTTALAAGDAEASYDAGTNTLTIRGNGDTVDRDAVATAVAAVDGFEATAGTGATVITFNTAAPADAVMTATAPEMTISADTAGAAHDGATIEFVSGGANAAAYNAGTNTLTVTVDNTAPQTLADLKTVIDATDFNVTIDTPGELNIANTTVADGTTSGGTDAFANDIAISAGSSIEAGTTVTFLNSTTTATGGVLAAGAAEAVYDEDSNTLTIRGNGDTVTKANVVAAIGAVDGFSATAATTGAMGFESALPADLSLTATTPAMTIAADDNSASYAGATISFVAGSANAAAYDAETNTLTVTVDDSAPQTLSDLKALIDTTGFNATVTTDGELDIVNTTIPDATAVQSEDGGLAADLVFELTGTDGSETFNFKAGATANDVAAAVNLVSDATGVTATLEDGALTFGTSAYGSKAKVAIEVISEGTGGNFTDSLDANRDQGTDIVAQINGTLANGKGNRLSINTATLDLSLSVREGSATNFSFDITGGGAMFQLGSSVVSNQQARLGISSVSTGKLGGTSGRLYELGSGQAKSLATDAAGASKIVDEVITKVTSLRGRLGAFQATTLESNLVSLNDTVANLQEAESSIRDADFAAESAKLTRAQILVQSGTNVLALANQNPQNVLSLIR